MDTVNKTEFEVPKTRKEPSLAKKGSSQILLTNKTLFPRILRLLKIRQQEFANSLVDRLGLYLQADVRAEVKETVIIRYDKLISQLPNPTCITLFKLEPLKGIGMLEMPPQFGLTLCERLLGGKIAPKVIDRALSEIEIAIVNQVLSIIIEEWATHLWKSNKIIPGILGNEYDPTFINIAPAETDIFSVILTTTVNDITHQIKLAIPLNSIEPIIEEILNSIYSNNEDIEPVEPASFSSWNSVYDSIPVNVSVEIEGPTLKAFEIASINVGDTFKIPDDSVDRAIVKIGGAKKFSGRLGQYGNYWAVELTEKITE